MAIEEFVRGGGTLITFDGGSSARKAVSFAAASPLFEVAIVEAFARASPPAAWAAAGVAARQLHDAPLPPWPGRSVDEIVAQLDGGGGLHR